MQCHVPANAAQPVLVFCELAAQKHLCPILEEGSCKEAEMLQVIEVDLGSTVPAISNLRALPCPTAALWPQAVFDLDYGGLLQLSRKI